MTSGTKINRPRVGILCLRRSTFLKAVEDLHGSRPDSTLDVIGTDDTIYHRLSNLNAIRGCYFDRIVDLLDWDRADATIAQKLRDNVRHRIKKVKG